MLSSSPNTIHSALQFIDASDRDTWIRMGMAIKSALPDSGFSIWEAWSQQAESFNAKDAQDVWKSIDAYGKVTIGTLFYEAKANGWHDDDKQEAEQHQEQAQAAIKALTEWNAATPATAHPYLTKKRVKPHHARISQYQGISQLIIPIQDCNGHIASLQRIYPDGTKLLFKGGKKQGNYSILNPQDQPQVIGIGEGFATVASIIEADSTIMGVMAIDAGNLPLVAVAMREQYPQLPIFIFGDMGDSDNKGARKAKEAADSIGGYCVLPPMIKGDFNDYLTSGNTTLSLKDLMDKEIATATVAIPATAKSNHWPEPQPLTAKITPEPYPLDALPNTIRAAVEEVAGFVKAPIPLIASSALAALSLAIQAHVDVKRADKLHGPTGLFLLTIADSGERKSTCDGFFTKAIRDYEQAEAEAARPVLNDYQADIEAWMAKCAGVKEKIRQLAKGQKPTADMESALRELQHDKPEPPRIPRLLYADATPEALAYGLANQWPSGGVVSAEAGIVFGSHGMGKDSVMRNLGLLNQLWDGASLTIDRRSTESFTVRGARLTVALQVQEPTLREFFAKSGALARGTGFLARFLIAWPESTQGQRPFTEAPANWPALAAFHQRITTILNQPVPIEDGALTPAMLSLAPDAKTAWVEYHDAIEADLSSGGELYDVRDVASKSADNAARLAALFQLFEHGMGGAIGADAFEGASRITAWHLSESRRFFGELALPAELADAARLDNWLIEYCQKGRVPSVGKNYIRQHGPLRDGTRLDAAIRELVALDRLRIGKDGKRVLLIINPVILTGTSS